LRDVSDVPAVDQDPPGRVARLNFSQGAVSFQPGGENDWVTAVRNRPMVTGDNLWADRDARAEVQMGSTSVRLAPETSLTFLDLEDNVTQLRVSVGSVFFRVRHLDQNDTFEVDTPNLAFNVYQPGEYRVDWTSSIASGVENPVIHSAFGYAAQLVVMDRETGAIERVVAAHDVGRAVNPLQCVGQIEGAVHMGLGYALTEDFPCDDDARPTHMTLRRLGIIPAKDVPPIEVILVEEPQPRSPYGIKGVGEIGLVPTAGAVAAALHDLDGEWRASLPMTRS